MLGTNGRDGACGVLGAGASGTVRNACTRFYRCDVAVGTERACVLIRDGEVKSLPGWLTSPRVGLAITCSLAFSLVACGKSNSGAASALESLKGNPAPYSVVVTGTWPESQIIGVPVDLQMRAQNIGHPIPHLVLVFDGLTPSWEVLSERGCGHRGVPLKRLGADPTWDFGPMLKNQICDLTFRVVAKRAPDTSGPSGGAVYVRLFGAALKGSVGDKVPVNGGMQLIGVVNQ
jgi:hypothetical protein